MSTLKNQGEWKITFNHHMKKIGDENCFNSVLDEKHLMLYVTPNIFFYDVMKHWYRVIRAEDPKNNIWEQSLWFNSKISQNKKPIISKKWTDKGVLIMIESFENCNIVSIPDLKAKFHLDEENLFTYHKVKGSLL